MKENIPFAEDLFRDFVENSCELVCCMDRNDKIVYANGSWKDKIGFVEKETLSLKIWDLIHPAHIEKCKVYFEKMKSGKRPDPKTAGIETVFISTGNKPSGTATEILS